MKITDHNKMKSHYNAIGLMSGTSGDGIDVSLIKTDGDKYVERIAGLTFSYKPDLIKKIRFATSLNIEEIAQITKEITLLHHEAVCKIKEKTNMHDIDIIGFHGQTILHQPQKRITIQIGNPQLLTTLCGIPVIADFRQNDIAQGGQGAPITPIYHQTIIPNGPTVILNIGGISNATYIDKNSNIISADTGPGCFLYDKLYHERTGNNIDYGGKTANTGKFANDKLNIMLQDSYFTKNYPKSLDAQYFVKYLSLLDNFNLEDALATLAAFTAGSAIKTINLLCKAQYKGDIILTGGGRHNLAITALLQNMAIGKVINIDDIDGLNGDYIESEAMAYIAVRSILRLPITFPKTTGVTKPLPGGVFYQP